MEGPYGGKEIAPARSYRLWTTILKNAKEYVESGCVCQRILKWSRRNEFTLHPVQALQPFGKWVFQFVRPIN